MSTSFCAPASGRVMPVTACPRRADSVNSGWPIAPLAPPTKLSYVEVLLEDDRLMFPRSLPKRIRIRMKGPN